MKKASTEISVGVFVLIGLLCVGYLTIKLGQMQILGDDHYLVYARFDNVSGLRSGAQIELSGVKIGQVAEITLDDKTLFAVVAMKIKNGMVLTDDTIVSVKTSGLIGDKYLKISPGGSEEILKAGDMITDTESAVDMEELISKYVFGGV